MNFYEVVRRYVERQQAHYGGRFAATLGWQLESRSERRRLHKIFARPSGEQEKKK